MINLYEAVTDAGGGLGPQLSSGAVDELFRKVLKSEQASGIIISRKVYFKNDGAEDLDVDISLLAGSTFPMIMFESTGDAQVVGDLTGSEVNETPISVPITVGSHVSVWLQMQIPISSTVTDNYSIIDLDLDY